MLAVLAIEGERSFKCIGIYIHSQTERVSHAIASKSGTFLLSKDRAIYSPRRGFLRHDSWTRVSQFDLVNYAFICSIKPERDWALES